MEERKIVGRQFMHSCNVRTKFGNAIVVKERVKYDDGTIEPNIAIFKNPKRSFYLTQQKYRHYKYKPEYELISKLDKYTFSDHECNLKLAQALELPRGYLPNSDLFKSPYVFGADISIEALIKMRYLDNYPDINILPVSGFLDIETSIDTGDVILISYICGNKVFTSVLRSFLYKEVDNKRIAVGKDELLKHVHESLSEYTTKYDLVYDIEIFDTEIQLIAWIFKRIHEIKADFIGIWNMNYDIPQILAAISRANSSANIIFSDPAVPRDMRYLKYYEDQRPVAHFTLKWHWLYSTCGSQFIDSMGLYSQCRKTNGFRARYDLDSVLNDEVNMGKLKLAEGQSHVIMQRHHFLDYVSYNIVDVLGLSVLEKKNNDILSMTVLVGPTPVSKFSAMTVRATNSMYWDLINKGMVLSSSSSNDNFIKFDKLFGTSCGGTVLPPERVIDVGIKLQE